MIRVAFVLLALLAAVTPATARAEAGDEVELVGRLVDWTGPRVRCGRMHTIGDMTYEVVRAIRGGAKAGERVFVSYSCPMSKTLAVGHHYRIVLGAAGPKGQGRRLGPDGSPRRWVLRSELAAAPGALLGKTRSVVDRDHGHTSTDQGWERYGDALAIRYEEGLAVRVRAKLPDGLSCSHAARWMGFAPARGSFGLRRRGGCDWPGVSIRHRLASNRAGSLRDAVFEAWISD